MSHRLPRRLTALLACSALILAGCSDDDDDGTADQTTTTTPAVATTGEGGGPSTSASTTTRPVDPASEAAMERAESLNLNIDDFPSGWQNLPQAEAEVGVVELCSKVDLETHRLAQARSDAFSFTIEPGILQASSAVLIVDDEAAAVDLVEEFRTDAFVQCATDILSRNTDTYTVTGSLSRADTDPDLGDEAVALSGDFTITPTDDSPAHTLSAVVVAIRKGDTVVTFNTTASDRAFEEETTRGLLTVLDERMEA